MDTTSGRTVRATIDDVARLASVSTATASRVLSRSARVSESLQQRVLAAAETLGYRVNGAARALRRDRTSMAGVLVPDLSNPFFTQLIGGIERRLQEIDMSLLICSSHDDVDIEFQRIQSLMSSRADVLIVTPTDAERSSTALRSIADEVPVIQVDQFADGVDADWVGIDERRGIALLVAHLAAQGVSTAAFVGGTPADSSSRSRFETVRALCSEHNIVLVSNEALLAEYSPEWGQLAVERLLSAGPPPDAIICGADVIALGALAALDAARLMVPDRVLVTGFDDIALSSHPRLSITTVRQPVDAIARKTVELVVDIVGNSSGHRRSTYALEPELMVRSSSTRLAT